MEVSAMIEHAVKHHFHTTIMRPFDQLRKQRIGGGKIGFRGRADPVTIRIFRVLDDHAQVRIHVIVILCIIFMA